MSHKLDCLKTELLSAYLDQELDSRERQRVLAHLGRCPRCSLHLNSLKSLKASLQALPAPALPQDLQTRLQAMIPASREGFWVCLFREIQACLSQPAGAFSFAITFIFLVFMGLRSSGILSSRHELPVDFLVAAHNQYALTLPLAPTEKILSEIPVQVAGELYENRDVY